MAHSTSYTLGKLCRARPNTDSLSVPATYIVALISPPKSDEVQVVVTLQFRPPVNQVVVDFPSGLVEPGETEKECALRELKEETGFGRTFKHLKGSIKDARVKVLDISDVIASEPGENLDTVFLDEERLADRLMITSIARTATTATKLKRVLVRIKLQGSGAEGDTEVMQDQFTEHGSCSTLSIRFAPRR